ncbi:hepatic lectin-like [Glandiceps talaboti]
MTVDDVDSPDTRFFFPEMALDVGAETLDASTKWCRHGWQYYAGSCYFFSQNKLSWYDAKSQCEAMNAVLVIIENRGEDEFIDGFVANTDTSVCNLTWYCNHWIGLKYEASVGAFKWIDGTDLIFDDWEGNEPNENKCGNITLSRRDWIDSACAHSQKYICEMPI